MVRFAGQIGAVTLGAIVVMEAPDAAACDQLEREVRFVLPDNATDPQPIDGALLAHYTAPATADVQLLDADGQAIEVVTTIEWDAAHESALVLAWPAAPLAAERAYVWSIDGRTQAFVTGVVPDPAPPIPGMASAAVVDEGVEQGCGAEAPYVEHELTIAGIDEPFAILASAPDGLRVHAGAPSLLVRMYGPGETCYALRVMDRGGHLVDAGTICLQGPDDGDTSSGGDISSGGGDISSGGGDSSEPDSSSGTTANESAASSDSGGDATADSGSDGSGQDVADRGCGCGVGEPSAGHGILALAGLLLRRRRRGAIAG
jgi:MYXO-CTERM domain-containing protein